MAHLITKDLDIPIYRGKLVIVFSDDPEKVKQIIPEFSGENVYAHSFLSNFDGVEGYFIVLNFNNEFRKIKHGTIAHEAYHILNFLADNRGFIPNFVNDEPMAYILEWIVDEVYKFLDFHDKTREMIRL